jgi:formylglycine-generating enzyme required for sulfatase activity
MLIQKAWILRIVLLAPIIASCARVLTSPPTTEVPPSLPPTSMPTSTLAPGQTRLDPAGIQQVWVPAGSFLMGTDDATIQELQALNSPPALCNLV